MDRKKRLIISGGENIYPSELERILLEHPGVSEAFVLGVPHPRWGEVPVAAFEYHDRPPDVDSLAEVFEGRLGHMKHPKRFFAFEAMPRNAMGKVVAARLAEEIEARMKKDQPLS